MLRNIIGPAFNFRNCVFFVVVFCLFFKIPLLSAGRMRFSKMKNKKKHWTNKGQTLDQFLTLQHAYIYIYAVKLLSGPSLAISGVIIWAK